MGLSVHLKIFCLDIFFRCVLLHFDHEHSFFESSSHDLHIKFMTGSAIQREGFETVTVACELAIEERTISADALLNILSRLQTNPAPAVVATPEQLCLKLPPIADYGRYDALLSRSAEGCA